MRKTNKRGFTIVELVIVIAVIAILAAVLIPTFSNLVKKANVTADTQLVRNLNTALTLDNETHATMYDALKAVNENGGFDVAKINASVAKNEILWDSVNDCFVYLNGGEITYIPNSKEKDIPADEQYRYWRIFKELPADNNSYSVYWNGGDFDEITVTGVGFDAGNANVASVTYNGASNARDIVIRTNGGSLTINDTNNASHQYHYGSSANVTVATGTSCYECHAIVAAMKITEGKVIADKGSYVGIVEASSSVVLKEENGGVFVIPTNVPANKVPAAVASQIGYTNDGTTITASAEKAEKSYYVITSYADLTNFVDKWNSGLFPTSANVKFANNVTIDLGASEAWTPIGNWDYPFNGTFDGNGCVISGLTADATHQDYEHIFAENASVGNGETYGFFGIVGGGDTLIKNLTLKDVNIDLSSANNVGALIGYVPNNSKFQETNVTEKWKNDSEVGTHKVTISGVNVTGSVSANSHVSGFIGKNYSSGDISFSDCHNYAAVSGKVGYIGGLIGIQNNSSIQSITIINCTNNGNITKTGPDTGTECCAAGLIARVVGSTSTKVTITNCKNTGNITSIYSAYAYVHINTADTPSITGCTNTGTLTHGDGYNSFE